MNTVREAAMSMECIDTHGHLPREPLASLTETAQTWGRFKGMLDFTYNRAVAEGCRLLYGTDPGTYLKPDSPRDIFEKASLLRGKGTSAAIAASLDFAKIRTQLAFTDPKAAVLPCPDLAPRVRYLAYIDDAVNGNTEWPSPDMPFQQGIYYENLCKLFGPLGGLDDYLAALDAAVDSWRPRGVVGLKTVIAYTSGLYISDPAPQEVRAAFARKHAMTEPDFRAVHDFAFRHVLDACRRNAFPVVFHTGFLAWGRSNLDQANPLRLHNLLVDKRYKDVTFVLLHGGVPYIGETTYLGGFFHNVIIDFTGLAFVSRTRLRFALSEWLQALPSDRMCWGSDSNSPETIAAIDRMTRTDIAGVLESMMAEGMLDEHAAMECLENMYLKTAGRVFGV